MNTQKMKRKIMERTYKLFLYTKCQGSIPCIICQKITHMVLYDETIFSNTRVCCDCMKKSCWQIHTKSVILKLMKLRFTTVPKDIWELLSNKYLSW